MKYMTHSSITVGLAAQTRIVTVGSTVLQKSFPYQKNLQVKLEE